MKTSTKTLAAKTSLMAIVALLATALVKAQDKVDVDINAGSGGAWYASPWVWVVGGAIFILLLVALLRGGGSRSDA